jgi:hypothetical protein
MQGRQEEIMDTERSTKLFTSSRKTSRKLSWAAFSVTAPSLNVVLGTWLFISAFLWDHSAAQQLNSAIVGALVTLFAVLTRRMPEGRIVTTLLAVWLFVSTFGLSAVDPATVWNNALCAISIFAVSTVPAPGEKERSGVRRTRTV